jgi:hypothetical protein
MLATGLRLASEATPTSAYLVLIAAGFSVLALTSIKPVWVIAASALCGLLLK